MARISRCFPVLLAAFAFIGLVVFCNSTFIVSWFSRKLMTSGCSLTLTCSSRCLFD
ncbi:hypothetical protein EVA_10129 [gut metagenome]|uniref:Uncharacterized protein n=1 Tax=gut metagenome TaxID=749906 RepID=J9CNS2_9ZZZZ